MQLLNAAPAPPPLCSKDPNVSPEDIELFTLLMAEGTQLQAEVARFRRVGDEYQPLLKPIIKKLLGSQGVHTARAGTGCRGTDADWRALMDLKWLLTNPGALEEEDPGAVQALLRMLAQQSSAWQGVTVEDLKLLAPCLAEVVLFGPFDVHRAASCKVGAP